MGIYMEREEHNLEENNLRDFDKHSAESNLADVNTEPQTLIAEGEDIDLIDANLISELTAQVELMQDKLLRAMAETENTRTRMSKMIEEARDYSIVGFAKDLVPVIDNLSRALSHIPENLDDNTKMVVEGIMMTKKELDSVFKKHGLESIEPQAGENFDYNNHYAISQIVTDQYKEGNIVSTMQTGYRIKDRLLRPASVAVAKK